MNIKPVTQLLISFHCGALMMLSAFLFKQDWYGYDEYIIVLKENWINIHWLIWAIIFIWGFFTFYNLIKRVEK